MGTNIEEEDETHKKVVKDLGSTPGNDRALTLSCGHVILVDLPRDSSGGAPNSWLGEIHPCYECESS